MTTSWMRIDRVKDVMRRSGVKGCALCVRTAGTSRWLYLSNGRSKDVSQLLSLVHDHSLATKNSRLSTSYRISLGTPSKATLPTVKLIGLSYLGIRKRINHIGESMHQDSISKARLYCQLQTRHLEIDSHYKLSFTSTLDLFDFDFISTETLFLFSFPVDWEGRRAGWIPGVTPHWGQITLPMRISSSWSFDTASLRNRGLIRDFLSDRQYHHYLDSRIRG
jgi:hypothetical protein